MEGGRVAGPRAYTRSTVAALAHLSGGLCYWPGCPEPVLREVEGKLRVIVDIAHIHAAEPGGARHDPAMTDDERRDQANLILFCHPHHYLVDDKTRAHIYTAEALLRWKSQREAAPREALKRLREVTPSGLRRIVAGGLEEHDARILGALDRLEKHDREAAALMRNLMDELTEAYSLQRRRALDPDMVAEFGQSVKTLRGMRGTLDEFITAATAFRRRPPGSSG